MKGIFLSLYLYLHIIICSRDPYSHVDRAALAAAIRIFIRKPLTLELPRPTFSARDTPYTQNRYLYRCNITALEPIYDTLILPPWGTVPFEYDILTGGSFLGRYSLLWYWS